MVTGSFNASLRCQWPSAIKATGEAGLNYLFNASFRSDDFSFVTRGSVQQVAFVPVTSDRQHAAIPAVVQPASDTGYRIRLQPEWRGLLIIGVADQHVIDFGYENFSLMDADTHAGHHAVNDLVRRFLAGQSGWQAHAWRR